jgi:assimilatory nitrate reductase catalytic subunit
VISRLLRQVHGPLTRDLDREPGGFGLGQVARRLKPDATTGMICGFCSTGCSLDVHLRDGAAVNVSPTNDYPVNGGAACPKGWEALAPLRAPDRATTPLLRDANGRLAPVSWATAIETFVARMKAIQAKHGDASVAFLGTGQMPTEELAMLGALAKFGMGIVHGDGNTRQCMATAVVAYKQAFGFDAPPYTYKDLEESDVLVFVGANPCIAHPILWARVTRNPHRPEIVVIDPRRTETAMAATMHLPVRPKSDLVLFYGLANLFIQRGWIDRAFVDAHTVGYDELAAHVAPYTPERVATETGLGIEAIERLAALVHEGRRVSFWWTMGVNQSHEGVRVAQAIINLALLTGNIGRPGTGANSITGQCNAMGSRLFANATNLLGGHDFASDAHRRKVAAVLGLDPACIPQSSSLAYDQILDGISAGTIRGLWVVATNTAHSWINQAGLDDVLGRLDFLVVQDMYATTETAQRAHLVLPAAGWGEKDGTFINSERRIGLIKRVARAPGEALADFYIFKLIAEAWGCGEMFRRWSSPEAVFDLLAECTRGQPCDITGIRGYDDVETLRGVQWPLPAGQSIDPGAERRLFEDGRFFHADGKARLIVAEPTPLPEAPDEQYPFTLLTGRGSSGQWHTLTRTGKSPVLGKLSPRDAYVEINPADAATLGIAPGANAVVESRRGKIVARAFVTHGVQPKQVFVPMHYARTNQLTKAAFDPYSRQPAYKACAVRVRPLGEGEKVDGDVRRDGPPVRTAPRGETNGRHRIEMD